MIAFVNGRLVDDAEATVSVFDRGFLYGDSVFETLRIANGRPFRWSLHIERLRKGAEFLGIPLLAAPKELRATMAELVRRNDQSDCLLRLTLSRGPGRRGYSPGDAGPPTLVMTLHELPSPAPERVEGWRLHTASFRLPPNDRINTFKVGSRLLNVLARAEAEAAGAHEALLLNTNGEVLEAAGSNLFWIKRNTVITPPAALGALPGITRAVVLELCPDLGLVTQKRVVLPEVLHHADAVFLTNSGFGVVPLAALDGRTLGRSDWVTTLREAYEEAIRRETG